MQMRTSGGLRIDPVVLEGGESLQEIEIVVPYTEWSLANAVLRRTESLTAGLNPTIRLVAVHSVPYPLPFGCPSTIHAHLVEQLVELASHCPFHVDAQVVLARYQDEGLRHMLKPQSIVMIGTRKQLWRTREERLARNLAHEGYRVALLHIE
jgi:hypothetical protein